MSNTSEFHYFFDFRHFTRQCMWQNNVRCSSKRNVAKVLLQFFAESSSKRILKIGQRKLCLSLEWHAFWLTLYNELFAANSPETTTIQNSIHCCYFVYSKFAFITRCQSRLVSYDRSKIDLSQHHQHSTTVISITYSVKPAVDLLPVLWTV